MRRLMSDISEFLAMGGYAFYVWPTYVLAVIVLGGLVWQSLSAARAASRRLAADSKPAGAVADRVGESPQATN